MESLGEILARIAANVSSGDSGGGSGVVEPEVREVCPVCRGRGFVVPDVRVGHPDFGRAFPCPECRSVPEGRSLLAFSNLGGLAEVRFENTVPSGISGLAGSEVLFLEALEWCCGYAGSPDGWVVLTGPAGSGKTHLAACVVNRRLELGEPAYFVVCADLLDHLRAGYGPGAEAGFDELLERVMEVPLLAVDGVGSHYGTPWSEEKLLQIFDHRYRRRLPTVVTLSVPLARVGSDSLRLRLSDRGGVSRVLELARFEVSSRSGLGEIAPEMESRMTFASFDVAAAEGVGGESLENALAAAGQFAGSLNGWLVLAGDHGCGKTHLAVAVAAAARARGVRTMFAFVPSLLDHLRAAFSPDSDVSYDEVFEQVQSVELLVLDGLGSERSTPWVEEKLGQLVSLRYAARRPTVITTAASIGELRASRPGVWARLMDHTLVDYRVIASGSYYG